MKISAILSTKVIREFFLIFIMFAIALFLQKFATTAILLPLILLLSFLFWYKGAHLLQAKLCLMSLCLGSEVINYILFIFLITLLFLQCLRDREFKVPKSAIHIIVYLILILGSFSYVLTQTVEANIYSFPLLFLTLFSSFTAIFYFTKNPLDKEARSKIFLFFFNVTLIQSILSFLDFRFGYGYSVGMMLKRGTLGDFVKGTFNDSDLLVFFICSVIAIFLYYVLSKKKYALLIGIGIMSLIALLASARLQILSFLISSFVFYSFFDLFVKHRWNYKILRFIIVVGFGLGSYLMIKPYIPTIEVFGQQFVTGKLNHKYIYYERALSTENRDIIQYFVGTGPGTVGSRSANLRATDILYKKTDKIELPKFIPPISSIYARKILAGLYTREYALLAGYNSSNLTTPFNSIAFLFIEFGMIGFSLFILLFCLIFFKALKLYKHPQVSSVDKSLSLGIILITISLIITAVITQIFEKGTIMFLFWFFTAMIINIDQELSKSSIQHIKTK